MPPLARDAIQKIMKNIFYDGRVDKWKIGKKGKPRFYCFGSAFKCFRKLVKKAVLTPDAEFTESYKEKRLKKK